MLSLALVALAIGVEYFIFDPMFGRPVSALATAGLLVVGVTGFSAAIWHLLERVEGRLRAAYAAERGQRKQLQALAGAAMDLVSDLDLDTVAQKIVERSREVTGARYGALAVLGENGRIDAFYTSGLDPETRARLGPPPQGHGLLGLVSSEKRPLRVEDVSHHPAAVGFPPGHPLMRTLLAVPVWVRGEVIGNLYLCDKADETPFTLAEQETLERFAAQAAVAIQTARLHRRLQELSILGERERIAMDLHDGVLQSLFGVRMQLEAALAGMRPDSAEQSTVDQCVERLGSVMNDVRHYVFDLRAELAEDQGLTQVLRQLIESMKANPVFRTELLVEGTHRGVARPVQWELWHVAREALTNAVRHSGGDRLLVTLRYQVDGLTMEVADNGCGWGGTSPGPGHHGLDNMRRRAGAIGGELELDSSAGAGMRVRVFVPAAQAYATDASLDAPVGGQARGA